MTKLVWDKTGERFFKTGVSHGVLYLIDNTGAYTSGFPWNGLTSVTHSPSGAESNKQYADNIVYANIKSAEEVGGTIEAFNAPDEFDECDGTKRVGALRIGQQTRRPFGFSWQTLLGNDLEGTDFGTEIFFVYGADASPSEEQFQTVNDSPEPAALSWEYTTTPVAVPGMKPAAKLSVRSTDMSAGKWEELTDILYGTAATPARLPLPAELIEFFTTDSIEVIPTKPTQAGNKITVPSITGVEYVNNGTVIPAGEHDLTEDTVITVRPKNGYRFPAGTVNNWLYDYTA